MNQQEPNLIIQAYGNYCNSPVQEVLPLTGIPVEMEDAPIHDGMNPCDDPFCPCRTYGYGVPALHETWEPLSPA